MFNLFFAIIKFILLQQPIQRSNSLFQKIGQENRPTVQLLCIKQINLQRI